MATHSGWADDARPDAPEDPRSLGRLVSDLSEQATRLVRAEISLAKAEVSAKAKQAGIGIGLVAGAAVLALYALGTLITTAILGLANAVSPWLAALIVSLVLLAITAVLGLIGVKRLQKGMPPVPDQAMENLQEDVDTVKKGMHR